MEYYKTAVLKVKSRNAGLTVIEDTAIGLEIRINCKSPYAKPPVKFDIKKPFFSIERNNRFINVSREKADAEISSGFSEHTHENIGHGIAAHESISHESVVKEADVDKD